VINQDPRKLGITAANMIIDEIEGKAEVGKRIMIDEQFIINGSIKKQLK
jgi:DNA-binding LacI/PurR family transcriptional regulator